MPSSDYQKKQYIKKLLTQVYTDYSVAIFPLVLIDSAIFFFILKMITEIASLQRILPYVFGVSPNIWAVLLVCIIFFTWRFNKRMKQYSYTKVEERVPEMKELLGTAHDTMHQESPVIAEFRNDVLKKASGANTAKIFYAKKFAIKAFVFALVVGVYMFLPLVASVAGILPTEVPGIDWFDRFKPTELTPQIDDVEFADDRGLYGDESDYVLGDNELSLVVDRSVGGGDITNPMAWQNEVDTRSVATAYRNYALVDTPAVEQLPEEYGLAKAYNLRIRELQ